MLNCCSSCQLYWELIGPSLVQADLCSGGLDSLKLWSLPIPLIISKGHYLAVFCLFCFNYYYFEPSYLQELPAIER